MRLRRVERKLVGLAGAPIVVELRPDLTVSGRKLLSAAGQGRAVYAASFIHERLIVLEQDLLSRDECFSAILVHELFHFVWVRLGNLRRAGFSQLLADEVRRGARGELGESSHHAKQLAVPDKQGSSRWKNYVCESFCDTAAYLLTGSSAGEGCDLRQRWLARRTLWFAQISAEGWMC